MININSNANFDFTRPVPGSQFDAIGGLEHELNEVLGGGGAGSALNNFPGEYGPTDLYRYSAPGTPSYSTSSSVSSYLSINGGLTSIVGFNQGAAPPAVVRAATSVISLRTGRGPASSFRTPATAPARTRPTPPVHLNS